MLNSLRDSRDKDAEHRTSNIQRPTSNSGFGFPERILWNHY
jgi:hypothetical protein